MSLREEVTKAMLDYAPIPAEKAHSSAYPFYYKDYADNLYTRMGHQALQAYEKGSGSETKPYVWKGRGKEVWCPPKMASIASSSAMTFNLLGNGPVTVLAGSNLPEGAYQVQYEKKMQTLNMGSGPANLDAFLSNEKEKTAIFCEMKMLEWLNEPGKLKDSYKCKDYYFAPGSYDVFDEIILKICKCQNSNPVTFKRYDVWQMFKHLLAIYNQTSFVTKDKVKYSMAGMYEHIVLANVVNEFPAERIEEKRTRRNYEKALEEEQVGARAFVDIINASGIGKLFKNDCRATFEIQYIPAKDFAACLNMAQARKDYLKRYFT